MTIDFICNPVAGGWQPTDLFLRGTEDSIVQWATRLAAQGHTMNVYHNSSSGFYEEHEGVHYENRDRYIGGSDICINCKSSDIAPNCPTIYFTNETNADGLDLSRYDAVVWPSHWAKNNIPVNNPNVYVVPHGYDPDRIYLGKKVAKQCFYASSPDRGLDVLLDAWPKVHEAHPDATLILTYGVTGINYPGIIPLGNLSEDEMDEVYRTSDIWCHPCTGGELFCITGVKAQVAGCVPVIIPTMALSETVKQGFFAKNTDSYADTLLSAFDDSEQDWREYIRLQLAKEHYADWDESTYELMSVINEVVQ